MIEREIEKRIRDKIDTNKAIIIFGPRQVGKTTLITNHFQDSDAIFLNGDTLRTNELFSDFDIDKFENIYSGERYLIIDEAQRIDDIGIKLKQIHDHYKEKLQIIATGSSSFDLANKINEPLTGRKWELNMFPVKFSEMANHHGLDKEKSLLHSRLLYGYYPDIVMNPGEEEDYLAGIVSGNLYKDILKWANINKANKLVSLLQALAYQIGSQVSFNEIGKLIDLNPKTVEKYILLLEQSFIIFRCGSFARNLRNELKSSYKYYFLDVGVRNAIINNFKPIKQRDDVGHLFENFIIAEFLKNKKLLPFGSPVKFWRNKEGNEIDYIDEKDGEIYAYEIKWNPNVPPKFPKAFLNNYFPKTFLVNRDNYSDYLV